MKDEQWLDANASVHYTFSVPFAFRVSELCIQLEQTAQLTELTQTGIYLSTCAA